MDISSVDRSVVCSFSVYTVLFLIGILKGHNTWLRIVLFSDAITGVLWTFFPCSIMEIQIISKPDASLCSFGRGLGAIFFTLAVLVHSVRSTCDKVVLSSFFISSLIGCSVHLVTSIYTFCYHGDLWKTNEFVVGTYGVALNVAGTLICYWPLRKYGGHTQLPSRLNTLLRANGVLILLAGGMFFACPEILVKINIGLGPYNALHLYYVRISSGYTASCGILCLLAPGFLFEADKRAVVRAQIVGIVISVLAVLYAAVAYEGWGNPANITLYLLLEGVGLTSALVTLNSPPETVGHKQD